MFNTIPSAGENSMKLKSNNFEHESMIPPLFTCDDRDVSPHLAWEEVPEGTKSFALIVDDPDAPMGTWVHWLVCNIPPDVREIPQGTVPAGSLQVRNDFGKPRYGGPCPPSGVHRYFFKLYALKVPNLEGVSDKNFYQKVKEQVIGEAVLMGKYTRRR
ncbi:MAG: YbhB/YbcL family Raf kinase inhibitor-like protein [Thermoplasmata archaeon]|nr:MAG: YbhB/YbcL family Raf kinase inhibitor-like protein [Thermoplasmata archaeon]